jgi:hypothetical protein
MDFDPVCVDDCRTVVCRAQDRAGEGTGRQLCFPYTRVRIYDRLRSDPRFQDLIHRATLS